MSDRTQTLSVEETLRGRLKQISTFMGWDRPDTWKVMEAKRIADTALSLSQPEHQGDETRPNALVEWAEATADSWSAAPPSEINGALELAHRNFAKRARELQPPAPVFSDGERERVEAIAMVVEHAADSRLHADDATFLRNLASREHRG